jgi:hypothetical protein
MGGFYFASGLTTFAIEIKTQSAVDIDDGLKVHKIENFFGSDFELCTISLLVMFKY